MLSSWSRLVALTIPGLNEFCSGFDNIGHNDAVTLIVYWIIPK